MNFNRFTTRMTIGMIFTLVVSVPNRLDSMSSVAMAESDDPNASCTKIGRALMANIGAVAGVANLGPRLR
jgi:hypothetical protein